MVWFQCEDCGENLKKPKLPNHFRCCSAFKLSCIDCGVTFDQNSVQGHNQCITESEKYGPKGQGKANAPAKNNNSGKPKPDVDINVGLTSRPPWFCSLCNTSATSQQTLMLHAEGKKHRAKARAFHASKQPPKQTEEPTPTDKPSTDGPPKEEIVTIKDDVAEAKEQPPKDVDHSLEEGNGSVATKKKRKHDASEDGDSRKNVDGDNSDGLNSGEVIQTKKKKSGETNAPTKKTKDIDVPENGHAKEANVEKIKWKKLIKSILKSNPDGALKMKKLQKLVLKSLKDSRPIEDEAALKETLVHKISSSSKFVIDEKIVRLAVKE